MTTIRLEFPAPAKPLSLNQITRGRGRFVYAKLTPWKHMVAQLLLEEHAAVIGERLQNPRKVEVELTIPFPDRRTRDPHNYVLVQKAVIDGIVLSGLLPGDDPEWVHTQEPVLVVGRDALAVLTITDHPLSSDDTRATL